MWRREKALAALYDELRIIEVFDRVHDYCTNADPAENRAYEARQVRRAKITAEIQKLNQTKAAKQTR